MKICKIVALTLIILMEAVSLYAQDGFKEIKGKYYTIKTDSDNKKLIEKLKRGLDITYTHYVKIFKIDKEKKFDTTITIYKDYGEYYQANQNEASAGAVASYNPKTKSIEGFIDSKSEKDEYEFSQTFFHEQFHQVIDLALGDNGEARLPFWLNEGLAECFGSCFWTKENDWVAVGGAHTSSIRSYVKYVADSFTRGEHYALKGVFNFDYPARTPNCNCHPLQIYDVTVTDQDGNETTVKSGYIIPADRVAYSYSWALCYYLYIKYPDILGKMIAQLKKSDKELDANLEATAFKGYNLDEMDKEWKKFMLTFSTLIPFER